MNTILDSARIVDNEFINVRTPAEYIDLMFERTREDGLLIEPFFDDMDRRPGTASADHPKSLRFEHKCTMDWSEADRDRVKAEFESLYRALSELAGQYDRLADTEEENAKQLTPELLRVWNTYVRKFSVKPFDLDRISDIRERCDICREDWFDAHEKAKELPEEQYNEMTRIFSDISEDEWTYIWAYRDMLIEQAEQRLDRVPMAFDLVTRAQRLTRLMSLHVPKFMIQMIQYEARRVAQAYAVLSCATQFETRVINPVTREIMSWEKTGSPEYRDLRM